MSAKELAARELPAGSNDWSAENTVRWALDTFGREMALVTSFQKEGMILLDMAVRLDPGVRVITIDTGRLPEETYAFIDQVRNHYRIDVEVHFPEAEAVRRLVTEHGVNLFYRDLAARLACCQVRKVEPLQRILKHLRAWMTGLRRTRSGFRSTVQKVEIDHLHGGIYKVNPLADWSDSQVEDYIREKKVPCHPLYARGYTSIGCEPCTRPIQPGEDARAGRWWWEKDARKECGMHCRW